MSFKDNFHTGAKSPEFACERIIGALADMTYPDGRPIDESQRVMVVDTFQTEKVTRNPEYAAGQIPVKPKFLREWKPYVLVQDRWGNPQYWPCASFLATFVPVNAEAPCEYEVESFLTDGFEELGTANQQIAARMFRNPPVEGVHVVHIDPAEKAQVIGAMNDQSVSVIREPVIGHSDMIAVTLGKRYRTRAGRTTSPLRSNVEGIMDLYPFTAETVDENGHTLRNVSYTEWGREFGNNVTSNDDIVGLLEGDSHGCCENESRSMNGGCKNCGDPCL